MAKAVVLIFLLLLPAWGVAFAEPAIVFESESLDFGEAVEGSSLTYEFHFRNAGTETLIINSLSAS